MKFTQEGKNRILNHIFRNGNINGRIRFHIGKTKKKFSTIDIDFTDYDGEKIGEFGSFLVKEGDMIVINDINVTMKLTED